MTAISPQAVHMPQLSCRKKTEPPKMDDEIAGCSWRWHFSLRTWTWTSVKGISTPVGHHHIIHHRSGTLNLTLRVEVLCLQLIATQKPDQVGSPLRTTVAVDLEEGQPFKPCPSKGPRPHQQGVPPTLRSWEKQHYRKARRPDMARPIFFKLEWVGGMMGMFCLTKSIA